MVCFYNAVFQLGFAVVITEYLIKALTFTVQNFQIPSKYDSPLCNILGKFLQSLVQAISKRKSSLKKFSLG